MKALIRDGVAVNVVSDDDLAHSFHPDTAAMFVTVPDTVQIGWKKVGGAWQAPEVVTGEPQPEYPVVDVPTFFLLLTASERVQIRASTDPMVKDWLTLLDDNRTHAVNLALPPVQASLNYMTTLATPLLTAERVPQILTGQFPA